MTNEPFPSAFSRPRPIAVAGVAIRVPVHARVCEAVEPELRDVEVGALGHPAEPRAGEEDHVVGFVCPTDDPGQTAGSEPVAEPTERRNEALLVDGLDVDRAVRGEETRQALKQSGRRGTCSNTSQSVTRSTGGST